MSLSLYPNVPNRNLFVQDTIPEYAAHGDQWLNTSAGVSGRGLSDTTTNNTITCLNFQIHKYKQS